MESQRHTPELLQRIDAYWRAANDLSVGQIYLHDNPLLERPLAPADIKHQETPQLAASVEQTDGFAEVFAEHKFDIVDVPQQREHIVGMTGDSAIESRAMQ